jgi:hypothetical protein
MARYGYGKPRDAALSPQLVDPTCAGYVRRVTHDEIADAIG